MRGPRVRIGRLGDATLPLCRMSPGIGIGLSDEAVFPKEYNIKSCAGIFWLIRYSHGGITR